MNKKVRNTVLILLCCLIAAGAAVGVSLLLIRRMQKTAADDPQRSGYSKFGSSGLMTSDSTFEKTASEKKKSEDPKKPVFRLNSPAKTESTTTSENAVLAGVSDPKKTLTMNGNPVERQPDGSFSMDVKLKIGMNTFTFMHGKEKTVCYITYRYVVLKSCDPAKPLSLDGGTTFGVSAVARAGSTVTAVFYGETITLRSQDSQKEAIENHYQKAEFVTFTGTFTIPEATNKDHNLGRVNFTATFNGITEHADSAQVTCKKIPTSSGGTKSTGKYAEVVAYAAETFNGNTTDDMSRPTNNYLPKGTVDNVVGTVYANETNYVKLRYGKRVYVEKKDKPNDVKPVIKYHNGSLPSTNKVSVALTEESAHYTTITFDTEWKAPFLFDLKPQQGYKNPAAQDYTFDGKLVTEYIDITFCYAKSIGGSISFPKDNPLFRRAELKGNVARLYLKEKGLFCGWTAEYNSSGQLVFTFLNPFRMRSPNGNDLTGARIMLDVGHGGKDSGTGTPLDRSFYEKSANLTLANLIKARLTKLGATVILNRTSDTTVSADTRCAMLQKEKPDYCLCIHHDGVDASSPNGFGAYYSSPFSKSASEFVLNRTMKTGIYKNSKFKWHYYYVARMTTCPVVLTESGFFTNTYDLANIKSIAANEKKADAMVQGIVDYFRMIYREAPDSPDPSSSDPSSSTPSVPTPSDPSSDPSSDESGTQSSEPSEPPIASEPEDPTVQPEEETSAR